LLDAILVPRAVKSASAARIDSSAAICTPLAFTVSRKMADWRM
jgi:hypothetical protein